MASAKISDAVLANAIRALSMDAVERARSGHPGAPMGMADIATVLWTRHLKHNPGNPEWVDRDRFVLSNGHASMLLYALLHLSGYALSLKDLQNFRQLGSKTPGHPEYKCAPGVETTTGPLGQGLAHAVGMALAEKVLAAQFNRPSFPIVDHYTYVFVGDGCLMEGVSHEACSLAGTLGLSKLIVFYDDNGVSIDGDVRGWFTDDTPARFRAYGWHVIEKTDGHDPLEVDQAIRRAQVQPRQPTLICCQTRIGFGAPNKAGTAACHGAPLGSTEIAQTRAALGWRHATFEVPEAVRMEWDAHERGQATETRWQQGFAAYRQYHHDLAAEFVRRAQGDLPEQWGRQAGAHVRKVCTAPEKMSTRAASGKTLHAYGSVLPELIGGSADLAASNVTVSERSQPVTQHAAGNYIHFGVREFAMTAMAAGLALHGGFIPYAATFLTFSDYARNAVRLAAMMKQRVVIVYTHDSVGLGADGPTHQPVEHLASLRLIPNLNVWRPCDAAETAIAWKLALEERQRPSALALSRQDLLPQVRDAEQIANVARGAYIIGRCEGQPDFLMIATGSEVMLAMEVKKRLEQANDCRIQVVSMPCCEIFERQDTAYRRTVLPAAVTRRLVIEAGATAGWHKYAGTCGRVFGIDSYGASAPGAEVFEHFGFSSENLVRVASQLLRHGV